MRYKSSIKYVHVTLINDFPIKNIKIRIFIKLNLNQSKLLFNLLICTKDLEPAIAIILFFVSK